MKILQLHNRYRQRGGEDGVLAAEAMLLAEHGHQVSQMFVDNPSSDVVAARELMRSPWNTRTASEVESRIAAESPDVIHLHNTWFVLSPASIGRAVAARPTAMTLHNFRMACINASFYRDGAVCTDCLGRSPLPGVVHACYRDSRVASMAAASTILTIRRSRVLERPGMVVLVHNPFARDVLEQSGIRPERIEIHENFVVDPGPRTIEARDSNQILFVGRLVEQKGVDRIFNAWPPTHSGELELVIVGDGPHAGDLAIRAAGMGAVEMAGRKSQEEVRRLMLSARCLVVPSRWFESQPLVILEALAAGLPIIAADWPPIRSILDSMPTGTLTATQKWTPDTLSPVLDDAWIERASSAARSLYEERFTPRIAYERLIGIYREMVRR